MRKSGKVWQVRAKYEQVWQVWQVQGQVWQASFDCSHHNVMAVAQQSLLSQGWKMPFSFPTGNMSCCAGFSFVKRQKSHFIFRYNPWCHYLNVLIKINKIQIQQHCM